MSSFKPVSRPRSNYAARLTEYPDVALADDAAFTHRGQWHAHFRHRIGPTFNGQIIFEIGCFDAAYLATIAALHPHTAFIGLDWKCKAIHHGAQIVTSTELRNVILLRGRAQDVSRIFGERELTEVWLFHPDPSDKPNELKNRLFAEPFLLDLHPILRAGAKMCLKTDHPGYYQWALSLFGVHSSADSLLFSPRQARLLTPVEFLPPASPALHQRYEVTANSSDFWTDPSTAAHTASRLFAGNATLFEKRFLNKNHPIYYLEIARR
jgi:tRNA G46 methylase TrmB